MPFKEHYTVKEAINVLGEDLYNDIISFTVVRNPFARVYSYYKYKCKVNENRMRVNPVEFNKWVSLVYKDFNEFYLRDTQGNINMKFFKSQCNWLRDDNGNLNIGYILRFEHLAKDFGEFSKHINVKGALPHLNKTEGSWIDAYNTESLKLIREAHKEDFEQFGYEN